MTNITTVRVLNDTTDLATVADYTLVEVEADYVVEVRFNR